MSVRKAHNSGRNHLRNVIDYYQQIGHEKAQSVIDSITSSYADAGQAAQNPMLQQGGMIGPMPGGPPGGMGFPPGPGGARPPFPPPFPGAQGMPPMNFSGPRPAGLPAHLPWPPPQIPGFPPPQGMPFPPQGGQAGSPMQGMPPFPPPGGAGMPAPGNFPPFQPGQAQSPMGGAPGQGFMPPGMGQNGPPGH